MDRRLVDALRSRLSRHSIDLAHVAGGQQQPVGAFEQPDGFLFVGLNKKRGLVPILQLVEPALFVGGEQQPAVLDQQVVGVLFLRRPQLLHRVVRIDPENGRLLHPRDFHQRGGRHGHHRLGRRGFLLLALRLKLYAALRGRNGDRSLRHGLGGHLAGHGCRHRRPPRDGAAHRRRVEAAVRHRGQRPDLGQVGVIENERLVLGGDTVEDPIRLGPGHQPSLGVEGQRRDVDLSGVVVKLALARLLDAEDLALVAGAHVEGALLVEGERPDVGRTGIEVLLGVAIHQPVDLPLRRRRRIEPPLGIQGQREDLRLVRRPQDAALARGAHPVDPPAVAGAEIERTVRRAHHGPDRRLIGSEDALDLRREPQPPFARERDAVELPLQEVGVGIHLPGLGPCGGQRQRQSRQQEHRDQRPHHSLTST